MYRKIHLFDIDLTSKGGTIMNEFKHINRGNEVVDPIYSPCGYLGLSISFDVRFPEMYRDLVLRGA
jgi:predicted amidohydrolase